MNFIDLAKKRHSTRSYLPDEISKKDIERIIEAGIYAPSAHNKQPWKFVVLQDKEKILKASEKITEIKLNKKIGIVRPVKDPIFYQAPVVILICMEKPLTEYAQADAAFCMQNCFLQAAELDLSTCAIGPASLLNEDEEIKKELEIPDNWDVVMAFCLGKEDEEKAQPDRKKIEIIYNI